MPMDSAPPPPPPPPPCFPCVPACDSPTHRFHYRNITEQPPTSPPPPPPPKPPRSPASTTSSPTKNDQKKSRPFIPRGIFLSQGIISLSPPPSPASRSAMVVLRTACPVDERDEVYDKLKELHSRNVTPKLVTDVALASIVHNIDNRETVDVLVSDHNPAEEVHEGIPDMIKRVQKYHQRVNDKMKEVWETTSGYYPLVPAAGRPELPPAPELNDCIPSVSMKLFTHHGARFADATSGASVVSFKKTTWEDGTVVVDVGEQQSGSKVLKAVLESLRRPENVVFEGDDGGLRLMMTECLRGYRRLGRMTKKIASWLKDVEGQQETW